MKTLKHHVILYDGECPMCNLYTSAFVKTGMLEKEGRAIYQQKNHAFDCVDAAKAVNEIPLVDTQTGKVYYGIRSLFKVLGHSFPFLQPLFKFYPFEWLMDKVYKFVSYNRRVMMPADVAKETAEHQPAFNAFYRSLYLIFTWLVTAFILYKFSLRLTALIPESNFYREFIICGGQFLWQGMLIFFLNKKKLWDYLGNMMTISFAAGLILALVMVAGNLVSITNPYFFGVAFMSVVGLMLLEHIRRMKLLHISSFMSVSWVGYRLIVLFIILLYV